MKPEVIMFASPTCSICKQMYPLVKEYDNITIINMLDNYSMAAAYDISSLPTFIHSGNLRCSVGSMTAEELEEFCG